MWTYELSERGLYFSSGDVHLFGEEGAVVQWGEVVKICQFLLTEGDYHNLVRWGRIPPTSYLEFLINLVLLHWKKYASSGAIGKNISTLIEGATTIEIVAEGTVVIDYSRLKIRFEEGSVTAYSLFHYGHWEPILIWRRF